MADTGRVNTQIILFCVQIDSHQKFLTNLILKLAAGLSGLYFQRALGVI
jgi:hypothetical protein